MGVSVVARYRYEGCVGRPVPARDLGRPRPTGVGHRASGPVRDGRPRRLTSLQLDALRDRGVGTAPEVATASAADRALAAPDASDRARVPPTAAGGAVA